MTFNSGIWSRAKRAWQYRSEPEEIRKLGRIFWRILLVIALAIFAVAIWFGFQETAAVSAAENAATPATTPTPPWSPAQLQTALNTLSARQQQYESLSQTPPPAPPDPSK